MDVSGDVDRKLVRINLAKEMGVMVGDRVRVLFGSEKGKYGASWTRFLRDESEVISRIMHDKNQVIVNGVNLKRSRLSFKSKGGAMP